MSNPVLIDDLEARFRPLVGDERTVAQALIDDAWAIAQAQLPLLATEVASGQFPLGVVRAVLSAMVIRVLRNPEGVRTWAVDDYSQTRDASVAAGTLYLSTDELTLMSASLGNRRPGAFSITPGGAPDERARGGERIYGAGYGFGYGSGSGYGPDPDWWVDGGYRW